MWTRLINDRRFWAGAIVFGAVLFLIEITGAVFGDGSAAPHLLRSLIWVGLTPVWYSQYRKKTGH